MRSAIVGVCLAAALARVATAQEEKGSDQDDWRWLRSKATAALVLEPPRLAGVSAWTIDSRRHRGAIRCLAVSPDGTRAATGGVDGLVRIWNVETGELEKALLGHTFHVYTMAWSSDGTHLATHSWGDRTLCIWDVAAGKRKLHVDEPMQMRSLRWSRDGTRLAGCTLGSGRIHVVDNFGTPTRLAEIGQPVLAIDWSADASRIAVASYDNSVNLVAAGSNNATTRIEGLPQENFSMLAHSPDGETLAVANSRRLHLVDARTGTSRLAIVTPVGDLVWSPDGGRIATVSSAGVRFWNASDGKAVGGLPARGSMIAWNASTGRIVVAADDRVSIWAPEGGEPERTIDAGGSAAPLFQAGRPLVTGLGTTTLTAWDASSFKKLGALAGHAAPVECAAWSPDGPHVASADGAGSVRIWDVKRLEQRYACEGHAGGVTALAWSADGTRLATAGRDKTARIWSAQGDAEAVLDGHASPVSALAWSPSGKQLVTGGRDKQLIIWDAERGAEQTRLAAGTGPVTSLAWSVAQGVPVIACGFDDGGIRVVNAATGEIVTSMGGGVRGGWHGTTALCWLSGKSPALLAGRYYLAQIWDVSRGTTTQRQIAPGGAASLAATAGGGLVVTRAEDRTVRFWDPAGGGLRGVVLDEGDSLVAVATTGDVKVTPGTRPGLIAILDTPAGQKTIGLDELAKTHGWKNAGKTLKLPTRN